jgi:hypothetical protein
MWGLMLRVARLLLLLAAVMLPGPAANLLPAAAAAAWPCSSPCEPAALLKLL